MYRLCRRGTGTYGSGLGIQRLRKEYCDANANDIRHDEEVVLRKNLRGLCGHSSAVELDAV